MLKRRLLLSLSGVVISGFCVGLFQFAALGVDPFTTLPTGLNRLLPFSYGSTYILINAVMLLFALVADRHYIGIATLINLFLVGYITQFSHALFCLWIPEPSLPIRFAALLLALVVLCLGSALYMTADLGVSAYDAVALIFAHTFHWGKFKYLRILTDTCCVLTGSILLLLGGLPPRELPATAGIATVVTAFFMGPLIDFFQQKIALPLLHGGKGLSQNANSAAALVHTQTSAFELLSG